MQDRIGFLINNLSNSNLEQKSKELKELLSEEYWPWFCDYMVVKRAAQEQNFHGLYASLLNALQVGVCMATAIHRWRRLHVKLCSVQDTVCFASNCCKFSFYCIALILLTCGWVGCS